jgi:hypothetical protein
MPSETQPPAPIPPQDLGITTVQYSFAGYSDENGQVDISSVLISHGYSLKSNVPVNIDIHDTDEEPLINKLVYYWIDERNDVLYLKIIDNINISDRQRLSDSYQVVPIVNIQNSSSFSESASPAFVAATIEVIMVLYNIYETYNFAQALFSVDFYYDRKEQSLIFEGTIGNFYGILTSLGALVKLPVALKRYIDPPGFPSINNKVTLVKATEIDPDGRNVSRDLANFLMAVGGLVAEREFSELLDTPIAVNLNILDGKKRFVTVDVLTDSDTPKCNSFYDLELYVPVKGSTDYDYYRNEPDELPDLYAEVIIDDGLPKKTEPTSYNFNILDKPICGVNICEGQKIEIKIIDEDIFFNDELGYFIINFDPYANDYFPLRSPSLGENAKISWHFDSPKCR